MIIKSYRLSLFTIFINLLNKNREANESPSINPIHMPEGPMPAAKVRA
jgi:hypothetical protein